MKTSPLDPEGTAKGIGFGLDRFFPPGDSAADPEKVESFASADWWNLACILALCAVVLSLRWLKMESLYDGDPSMWLSQVGRFTRGEMPYRDFSWNYPPLAILLLGWTTRAFGATFAVLQAVMDLMALAVVLLSYWLVSFFLPRSLHLVTVAALVAICSTALTKFNLFSFCTYSPSLQVAAIGLLLVLVGGVRRLRNRKTYRRDFVLIAAGGFLAATSKPEAMIAACGAILLLAVLDRSGTLALTSWSQWARYYGALLAAVVFPALAVYAGVGIEVGFEPLMEGLRGYGLATFACPWWPTGLGVFGAAAASGEAIFLGALLLWPFRNRVHAKFRPLLRALWAAALVGLALFISYICYLGQDVLRSGAPAAVKLMRVAPSIVWSSPALLPVMWTSVCVWPYWLTRLRRLSPTARGLCFLLSVPVIMSVRSLFGTTLFPYTEVSAMCYPFFVIAAPCLVWRFWELLIEKPQPGLQWMIIAGVIGGYSLLRFAAAYPALFADGPYYSLSTQAGRIRLSDGGVSAEIYRYIVAQTKASDFVLDLPYGGGFNFASGRPSPTFTTQFRQLRMSAAYQARDLQQVIARKPSIVIAEDEIHYGSFWGYTANMNCTFPRFQWAPTEPSWDPKYVFPMVRFIEQNYVPVRHIGSKLILVPARQ